MSGREALLSVDDPAVRMDPEAAFGVGRLHQTVFDAAIFASVSIECLHLYVQTACQLVKTSFYFISFFFTSYLVISLAHRFFSPSQTTGNKKQDEEKTKQKNIR